MAIPAGGPESHARWFAGVMTGTSMDAIDVAILEVGKSVTLGHVRPCIELRCFHSRPMGRALAEACMGLQSASDDELHRAALVANAYADAVGRAVLEALACHGVSSRAITAMGVHGQTIRHQPQLGFSLQLNAPARIAEITGITVVSDFRSRDIAAGGQGAPLVPAFHRAIFDPALDASPSAGSSDDHRNAVRAVVNIGGMANITWLGRRLLGYDTGPGNVLMDMWVQQHRAEAYDRDGQWAAGGVVHKGLLNAMLGDPFFSFAPPRSTGRDLFNHSWLESFLSQSAFSAIRPQDVQATLLALTARSIAQEVQRLETRYGVGESDTFSLSATAPSSALAAGHHALCQELLVCGGGAKNAALLALLRHELKKTCQRDLPVKTTAAYGWDPQVIEAAAFAWLAARTVDGVTGNEPAVTGAAGPRVLGSITPA